MEKLPPDMKLRISSALRQRIEAAAKASNRTMNAEIVSRLEFSFAVDVTVQDGGYDVGFGIDTPEMKAALLKQRLGDKVGEGAGDLADIRGELRELRREITELKKAR